MPYDAAPLIPPFFINRQPHFVYPSHNPQGQAGTKTFQRAFETSFIFYIIVCFLPANYYFADPFPIERREGVVRGLFAESSLRYHLPPTKVGRESGIFSPPRPFFFPS
ncbi:hypothetical protein CEXT_368011 [Caerostris extrusa]|uniref:Uncharacterized protein n=1 Tax=Caerostris extrusa TaxID=172846 RepID=A0AAV4N6K6_CAEEX|nr:hypothetical protein CEXT_368011 [Caerostris extrusa]